MPAAPSAIRSLVLATDIDVLAADKLVTRRDGYWRIQSPGNPTFWWGNLLLFDQPPGPGAGAQWPALFAQEFGQVPEIRHEVFAWDRPDGAIGSAEDEFSGPYELERTIGLVAAAGSIRAHPRASPDVQIRALDPAQGSDAALWQQVREAQAAQLRQSFNEMPEAHIQRHISSRQRDLREIFGRGHGAWYVALLDGEVAGSLGIAVTDGRARYQSVDTVARHRGRGIASRLVHEAAVLAAERQRVDHYVIAADPDYHAVTIYESLGFERAEAVCGIQRRPN